MLPNRTNEKMHHILQLLVKSALIRNSERYFSTSALTLPRQRSHPQTVNEFVEHAVSMLHEQEVWLAQNRSEIAHRIEEGYAAAERGELLDHDAARARLAELKH